MSPEIFFVFEQLVCDQLLCHSGNNFALDHYDVKWQTSVINSMTYEQTQKQI